jgi:hypothetical protein
MIKSKFIIDRTETMYPSIANYVDVNELGDVGYIYTQGISTCYGYVLSGSASLPTGKEVVEKDYFSFWSKEPQKIEYTGSMVIFSRIGFKGQNIIGSITEELGRLSYVDGCSDSILIYPPRLGDPSLNYLYFPQNIKQSFHTHPSIRMGVVISGAGYASLGENEEFDIPLIAGDMFCLDQQELHRFRTTGQKMIVLAYHPDGDWGPTDYNHIMLNRTYLTK